MFQDGPCAAQRVYYSNLFNKLKNQLEKLMLKSSENYQVLERFDTLYVFIHIIWHRAYFLLFTTDTSCWRVLNPNFLFWVSLIHSCHICYISSDMISIIIRPLTTSWTIFLLYTLWEWRISVAGGDLVLIALFHHRLC